MTPTARDWPLVSCIMPTYNRRHFVPRAIRSFLRQDFPHKELVIVDDGAEAVGDLVPVDPRVRYVRLERRATVGAKRNLACEQAAGPLIAHWDDDDWHAPRRLRCQVEALLHAGADLCGLRTLLFYDASHGRAWRYDYPDGHRPWLSGSSLLYTRNYWMGHRFPEIDVGEDSQFVWGADPRRLAALDDFTIHVGIIHGQNVAPKQTDGAWWRPHPVEEVRQILGEDWEADGPVATAMPPQPAADGARVEPGAPPGPPPIRNVFACLVHENAECVVDLVRNLRHLDPDSKVLLYNGSANPNFLNGVFPTDRHGAVLHPSPSPMRWGRLHDFAVDCMRFALVHLPFDTLTIVDSDQLAVRPGYSNRLAALLAEERGVGILSNSPELQGPRTSIQPARVGACRDRPLAALPPALPRRGIAIPPLGLLAVHRLHGRRGARPRPALRRGRAAPATPPGHQDLGHGGGGPADAGRAPGLSRGGQPVQLRLRAIPDALLGPAARGRHGPAGRLLGPPDPPSV